MNPKKRLIGNDEMAGKRKAFLDLRPATPKPPSPVHKISPTAAIHLSRQQPKMRPNTQVARPAATPKPLPKATPKPAAKQAPLNSFAIDLFIIVVLGFVAAASSLANWIFLIYAAVLIFLKTPSHRIFRSALICLVIIPLASILKRDSLANDFAIFAFYFLAIGVLRALLELNKSSMSD